MGSKVVDDEPPAGAVDHIGIEPSAFSRVGEALCLRVLGDVEIGRLRISQGSSHFSSAATLFREVGDLGGEADCALALGTVAFLDGRTSRARSHYADSRRLYRLAGNNRKGEAKAARLIAEMDLEEGRADEAKKRLLADRKIYDKLGDRSGVAQCDHALGDAAMILGSDEEAFFRYQESLLRYDALFDSVSLAIATWRSSQIKTITKQMRLSLEGIANGIWEAQGLDNFAAEFVESAARGIPGSKHAEFRLLLFVNERT